MNKKTVTQLALGAVVGAFLSVLLIRKDEIGFWLYGLPIAAVLILNGPLTGKRFMQSLKERLAEHPQERVSIYWQLIFSTWMLTAGAMLFLWAYGIERGDYGLTFDLGQNTGDTVLVFGGCVAAFVISALIPRGRARRVGQLTSDDVEQILPQTSKEKMVWLALSASAGIGEEIAYRGFLTMYFYLIDPDMTLWLALVLSTAAFGLAHTYQGPRGIVLTALLGAAFASIYWATESLLGPILVHTIFDMAVLLRRSQKINNEVLI